MFLVTHLCVELISKEPPLRLGIVLRMEFPEVGACIVPLSEWAPQQPGALSITLEEAKGPDPNHQPITKPEEETHP